MSNDDKLSDREKLKVILEKRPIEGIIFCSQCGRYEMQTATYVHFNPFESIDQAVMLLEGMEYDITIKKYALPEVSHSNVSLWHEDRWYKSEYPLTARAITEACYLAAKEE